MKHQRVSAVLWVALTRQPNTPVETTMSPCAMNSCGSNACTSTELKIESKNRCTPAFPSNRPLHGTIASIRDLPDHVVGQAAEDVIDVASPECGIDVEYDLSVLTLGHGV